MVRVWASVTTTTLFNVHRGAPLPAARGIVLLVPLTIGLVYWFFIVRRRGDPPR